MPSSMKERPYEKMRLLRMYENKSLARKKIEEGMTKSSQLSDYMSNVSEAICSRVNCLAISI